MFKQCHQEGPTIIDKQHHHRINRGTALRKVATLIEQEWLAISVKIIKVHSHTWSSGADTVVSNPNVRTDTPHAPRPLTKTHQDQQCFVLCVHLYALTLLPALMAHMHHLGACVGLLLVVCQGH